MSYVNTVDIPHKTELLGTGTSVKNSHLAIWGTDRSALRRSFAMHFRAAGPLVTVFVLSRMAYPRYDHLLIRT